MARKKLRFPAMSTAETNPVLRTLLREKIHVQANVLARLPSAQAAALSSPFDLGRLLLAPLATAPLGLLRFWADHARGHAVIAATQHGYVAGWQPLGKRRCDAVAWIAARRLLHEPGLAPPLAALFDHLLGSDAATDGPRLSDGVGRNAAWAEVGRALAQQATLGYAPAAVAVTPAAYFAWGMAAYLQDARALSAQDPGLERLLRTTIFSATFWQHSAAG